LGKGKDPLPTLRETAQNLEKAGADFIIIPCNTAHYFLPLIQEKETRGKISPIQKVGLLASIGIYKTGIYHQHFKKFNIEVISPEEKDKEEIMKVIYAVKAGDLSEEVKKSIILIAQKLIDKGAEAIIAGCTEIPLKAR